MGIDDVSATEAWAVGRFDGDDPLILHRTTSGWARVNAGPGFGAFALLRDVEVISADDVWAAGSHDVVTNTQVLTEHWDGVSWAKEAFPVLGELDHIAGLAALGTDDVWAVGAARVGSSVGQRGHWNGAAWSAEAVGYLGSLSDVAAAGSTDVWAVGRYVHDVGGSSRTDERIQHFDGTWTDVPGDSPGTFSNALEDVEIGVDHRVWAVGSKNGPTFGSRPLVEVWDGSQWSSLGLPPVGTGDAALNGVTLTGDRLWAVGYARGGAKPLLIQLCPTSMTDTGFSYSSAPVARGSSPVWLVPMDGTAGHSIVDGSGMALFDSGVLAPGAVYSTELDAAGTYTAEDPSTGSSMTLSVPISADPKVGSRTQRFTITWAKTPAAAGKNFDVQIKRPGGAFRSWMTGITSSSLRFLPDKGIGTYAFRARLRSASGHTGWSPTTSIKVTA